MKKITLLAVVALAVTSCKKERTCTCTTTTTSAVYVSGGVSYTDPGPFGSTKTTNKMDKVKKGSAAANCASGEWTSVYTDSDGDTQTTVQKRDCSLD